MVMSEEFHTTRQALGHDEHALILLGGRDLSTEVSNTEVWAMIGHGSDEWFQLPGLPYKPAIVPGPEAFNNQYLPVTTCLTTTSSPNYLYTLGGQEQWTYDMSKHVKAFSLTNGEWDCMRPLPAEAMGMWAGIIDDTLIAGGGRSSDFGPRVNDTVFCLDTTERNAFWKSLPTMPRGVSTAGAFVHNRKLFVIMLAAWARLKTGPSRKMRTNTTTKM